MSEAGIGAVILQPSFVEGVDWAEGIIPTKHGEIKAEWKKDENGSVKYRASLPAGVSWQTSGLAGIAVVSDKDRVHITGTGTRQEEVSIHT